MLRRYGLLGTIKLMKSLIYTKIAFPNARIIRLPFDIRNRRYIRIGKNFTTGFGCRLEAHPIKKDYKKCLEIGENVEINDYVHIAAGEKVILGNNVLIASKVFISDINHGSYTMEHSDSPDLPPAKRKLSTNPVFIEDNVWLGESVCVLPGVTIGKGSIIGSLSVVTKDIPPFSIAVGSPAKVVKIYDKKKEKWINAPNNK